jgi:hypothetical protein
LVVHVSLALFDGDVLMGRCELVVTQDRKVDVFELFRASHSLGADAADIVLDDFAGHIELKRSTLSMPIHESADWESIELDRYTLAFRCRVDG